jgi:hypothetical protein
VKGSVHGAQRSLAGQLDRSSVGCPATIGRQVDRQRPSAGVPAKAVHDGALKLPAVAMIGSGVQKPPAHAARSPS